MHIEPGIVVGTKIVLSYGTAVGSLGLIARMARASTRCIDGVVTLVSRSIITTALVLIFFQVFPHRPVGVSEVHLILGSTLLLLFGGGAAAIGLALGLLLQGLFFAPFDLPQYGMNVTTLLVPMFGIHLLAKKIIAPNTAYVDLSYSQVLKLSTAYQAGIVAWVGFWAIYGQGLTAANVTAISTFGIAYMSVILLEPIIDLAVLAIVKSYARPVNTDNGLLSSRLLNAA